jgi:membrane associated rhomboid family serine protease
MKQQQNLFRRIGRFLDEMDHKKVLWTMIGTNVVVFCCWQYAKDSYKQFGDSRWLDFMCRHFTLNKTSMDASQYHTLLTSTFSHSSLPHLAMNMFVLQSMGEGVLKAIGTSRFLLLYTGAGVVASLSSLVYSKYIRPLLETNKFGYRQTRNTLSLGASGSLMGLASFFAAACKLLCIDGDIDTLNIALHICSSKNYLLCILYHSNACSCLCGLVCCC